LTIRPEEFKPGLDACNAEGIYVVNLETSTVSYQMAGIRHMDSLGLNMTMYELGNEHNLTGDTNMYPNQEMNSLYYASLAKSNYDSIKAYKPSAKVCAVGGITSNHPNWHSDILDSVPNIEAFAWHAYINANNADGIFDVNRALAQAFANASQNGSLPSRFIQGGFNLLPPNKEIWVTEYNLWESQIPSATPIIGGTWTHLLYLTAMHNYFLSNTRVNIFLNHSLASSAFFYEAISRQDNHITASGIAMKLLLDVSRGSQTCQDMVFSGNPSMVYGSTIIPKLIGWKFNHTTSDKGFICNFSVDTFKISLASVFPNPMQFDEYYADTALVVNGLSSVNKYSGNSTDSLVIYPFSFTQIYSSQITGIQIQQNINYNGLWIYPNPSQSEINLQINVNLINAEVIVYNMAGQEIKRIKNVSGKQLKISTVGLLRGSYFIKINAHNQLITGKFIVE